MDIRQDMKNNRTGTLNYLKDQMKKNKLNIRLHFPRIYFELTNWNPQ